MAFASTLIDKFLNLRRSFLHRPVSWLSSHKDAEYADIMIFCGLVTVVESCTLFECKVTANADSAKGETHGNDSQVDIRPGLLLPLLSTTILPFE